MIKLVKHYALWNKSLKLLTFGISHARVRKYIKAIYQLQYRTNDFELVPRAIRQN